MTVRVSCAVLAAGCSARLGQAKQLVVLEGTTLARRAVEAARASRCDAVAAIVGARATEVEAAVAGTGVAIVRNAHWEEGIGASVRAAATWALARRDDALLLAVCDQPRLTAAHLDALLDAWRASPSAPAVASAYAGVLGVPALFPASRFPELAALGGERGAGALLRGPSAGNVTRVCWPDGALDVDTPADLERLRRGA